MTDSVASDPAIQLDRVTHDYRQGTRALRVLDGISLTIRRGEFVAIVGPSGCGKTTVLDLLSGLIPLQTGAVRVAGRPPHAGRPDTARMFARDALLPWLSAYANIEFAVATRPRPAAHRRPLIMSLLKEVGLEGFEQAFPRQLSQGMRQRVALARTFSLESDHVFLDEPFGALDAFTREELWDVLQDLWMAQKFTTILVTHDLREAVYLADKVHVMSRRPGHIVASYNVPIARPRRTETEFEPAFVEIVHSLREMIKTELTTNVNSTSSQATP